MPDFSTTGRGGAYKLRMRDPRKTEQALGYVLWCVLIVVLITMGA